MNGDKPVRCKVVNQNDQEYKPIPTPLKEGSFMLELCQPKEGYIFPSRARARSAVFHTGEYIKSLGKIPDYENYIVFEVSK